MFFAMTYDEDNKMIKKKKPNGYWTIERVLKKAKEFQTRKDFKDHASGAYQAAVKNGWLPDVNAIFNDGIKNRGYWYNKQNVAKEAKKYNSRTKFRLGSGGAYNVARKNDWLDEVCDHMDQVQKPHAHWNKDNVLEEATKYNKLKDFKKGSSGAYSAAQKNGWLPEVNDLFETIGNRLNRCLYVIINTRMNQAYVGLTYDFRLRMSSHKSGKDKATKDLAQKSDTQFIQLTDYIPAEKAILKETYYYNEYKAMGFDVLNSQKALGLLGTISNRTFEEIKEIALNYEERGDFKSDNPSAYDLAARKGWLKEITAHMPGRPRRVSKWTFDKISEMANKCESKKEFRTKFKHAYDAAKKKGWVEEVCANLDDIKKPNGYWDNKDRVMEIANKCETKKEFRKKHVSVYGAALKNGWVEEAYSIIDRNN